MLNDTRFMVDVTRDESGLSWDTFLSRMRSQHLCLTPDAHARIHVDYAAGIHELICYQIWSDSCFAVCLYDNEWLVFFCFQKSHLYSYFSRWTFCPTYERTMYFQKQVASPGSLAMRRQNSMLFVELWDLSDVMVTLTGRNHFRPDCGWDGAAQPDGSGYSCTNRYVFYLYLWQHVSCYQ